MGPAPRARREVHRMEESDTLIVFMHPVLTGAYLPIIGALAKAGHHILVASSRYRGNDAALLMEKVVSHPLRHHFMGCLLLNSMDTARKIRVRSKSMKAR